MTRHIGTMVAAILWTMLCVTQANAADPSGQTMTTTQLASETGTLIGYTEIGDVSESTVGTFTAETVLLRRTTWEPRSVSQQAWPDDVTHNLMKMPEDERAKVADKIIDVVQVWWMKSKPDDPSVTIKNLHTAVKPGRYHEEMVYLGWDGQRAWYAYMPIYTWIWLQDKLRLTGGEDAMTSAVRAIGIKDEGDCTRNSCEYILGQAGPKALPAVDAAIAAKQPVRARATYALQGSMDPAVTKWLIVRSASDDQEVAAAAKRALCWTPRVEATDLYVKWLDEAIRTQHFDYELRACIAVNAKEAGKLLPAFMNSPPDPWAYRSAFEFSRKLAGVPTPEKLLVAEKEIHTLARGKPSPDAIQRIKTATQTIIEDQDRDAALTIGLSLAHYRTKGSSDTVNNAGRKILRTVPGGRELVHHLAENATQYWKEELQKLDQALGK